MALQNEPVDDRPVGSWSAPAADPTGLGERLAATWALAAGRAVRLQRWRQGHDWCIEGWRMADCWLVLVERGRWTLAVDGAAFAMRPGFAALVPAGRRVSAAWDAATRRDGAAWGFHAELPGRWSPARICCAWRRYRPWLLAAQADAGIAADLLRQILCESVIAGELPIPIDDGLPIAVQRALEAFLHQGMERGDGVAELARQVGCTPTHLRRIFHRHLQTTPHRWLRHRRLERAGRLLVDKPSQPVAAIAAAVGYASATHFHTLFRRHYGQPPDRWRRLAGRVG